METQRGGSGSRYPASSAILCCFLKVSTLENNFRVFSVYVSANNSVLIIIKTYSYLSKIVLVLLRWSYSLLPLQEPDGGAEARGLATILEEVFNCGYCCHCHFLKGLLLLFWREGAEVGFSALLAHTGCALFTL